MSTPDHWQSLPRKKRLEMEKHARGLVRGSIIEDAASRFMAMCMAEAIGESTRRGDLCDPMQDERVKALVEASKLAREEVRQAFITVGCPPEKSAVISKLDAALATLDQST